MHWNAVRRQLRRCRGCHDRTTSCCAASRGWRTVQARSAVRGFQDLSVHTRLSVGFGLVLVLLAGVSGVALWSFNLVTTDLQRMVNVDQQAVLDGAEMERSFYQLDGALTTLVASQQRSRATSDAWAAFQAGLSGFGTARASFNGGKSPDDAGVV